MSDHPDPWRSLQYPGGNIRDPEQTWQVVDVLLQLPMAERREIATRLVKHKIQRPKSLQKFHDIKTDNLELKHQIRKLQMSINGKNKTIAKLPEIRKENTRLRKTVEQQEKTIDALRAKLDHIGEQDETATNEKVIEAKNTTIEEWLDI